MQKITLLLLIILNYTIAFTQTNPLTQAQIKEDAEIFIAALQEAHPGLNIHLDQSELNRLFDELAVNQQAPDLKAFYIRLLGVITAIGDGHTDLHEGKLFRATYPYLESTLPFDFSIINGKVYITKSYVDKVDIPLYAALLSVNDKPTQQILETLHALTPADGFSMEFKEAYNEKIWSRQYAKLIEFSDQYAITIKLPDGSNKSIKVEGVHDSILHSNQYDKVPLSFELHKAENYALLSVNTFQYRLIMQSGIDFHAFIETSFKDLRKSGIDNLIIDIRENYGGDNILAVTLYSYLTQGQFKAMGPSTTKLYDTTSVARFSNFPKGRYPYLRSHEVALINDKLYEVKNGIDSKASYDSDFIYKGPNKKVQNISKNKFNGTVYCLTSGLTFSAGANFATLLSNNKEVQFIGQETGGASGYFCGGGFYTVTLPHSQFMLQIPFMKRGVAGAEANENGVSPNYPIPEDVESLKKKEDQALLKAIELIKSKPAKD